MKLPNGHQAIIDRRKIEEYCLSRDHDDGKHKAHLFAELLGITLENADLLTEALMHAAADAEASEGKSDRYGKRYVVDFTLHAPAGDGTVRSAWIIRTGESVPRFVTCYLL